MPRRTPFSSLLIATALAVALHSARGQVIIRGGGIAVFGDDGSAEASPGHAESGGGQAVEFFDGRELHGTLEALDVEHRELTWRRNDASLPLKFSLLEVNRISFDAPSQESTAHATIKFTGGDWLAADVTKIQDNQIHFRLADGSALVANRSEVDWIYFSKGAAAECYEGPTSFSGWTSTGNWVYRDGALHSGMPSQIGRNFAALPDQVDYQFEVEQGNLLSAFNFTLHARVGRSWSPGINMIQFMVHGNLLNVSAMMNGRYKNEQVDLGATVGKALNGPPHPGKPNPVKVRVLEDYTGGRLLLYINGHKAGEWPIERGEPGKNRGAFAFQPTVWSTSGEQSLSKIRIVPWDGRAPGEDADGDDPSPDLVSLADGTTQQGKFIDLALGTFRIRTTANNFEADRSQLRLLRLGGGKDQTAPAEPVAQVSLAEGGEFQAAAIHWQNGKLQVRTRFGSEFSVPEASVSELSFLQSAPMLSLSGDLLIFKNGDRLQGRLEAAEGSGKLRWRTDAAQVVDFTMPGISGVRLASPSQKTVKHLDCVARFRNGDWLAGQFLTLDKDSVVLNAGDEGQLTIARSLLRALYFSDDGALPVSDAVADDQAWLRGVDLAGPKASLPKPSNLWRSFDGAYSLSGHINTQMNAMTRAGGIHIGRLLNSLPALVEISFDVSGQSGQVLFSAQLFSEPGNPGYLLQFHSQGLYIFDLNPGPNRRGVVPQQTQFDDKLKPNQDRRHIQLLANRDNGELAIVVDGVVVSHFGGKSGAAGRHLGHGMMLSPQMGMHSTFSNIWVAPWDGQLPAKTAERGATQETALLRNGDEVQGKVEIATPSVIKFSSDIGPLELPVDRLTMIDFGGPTPERSPGTRLHLAAPGSLTVSGCQIENSTVTCESEIAGKLKLPLSATQEIVFPLTSSAKH